jgi:hypothetical protein
MLTGLNKLEIKRTAFVVAAVVAIVRSTRHMVAA